MQSALSIALAAWVLSFLFELADASAYGNAAQSNPTRDNGQLSQVLKQFAHLQAQFEEQSREFLAQKTEDKHLEQEVQSLRQQLAGEVSKEQRLELRQQASDAFWGKLHSVFTDGSARLPGDSPQSSPSAISRKGIEEGDAASAVGEQRHRLVQSSPTLPSPVVASPRVVETRFRTEAPAAEPGPLDTKLVRRAPTKVSPRAEAKENNAPVFKTLTSVHLKREKDHVMKRLGVQKSANPSKTVVSKERHAAGTEVAKEAVVNDDPSLSSPFDALENQLKAENQKIDDLAAGGVVKDDGSRSSNNLALGAGDAVEGDQSHIEAPVDGELDAPVGSSDGKDQVAASVAVAGPVGSKSDVTSKEDEEADAVLSGAGDTGIPAQASASPLRQAKVNEVALPQHKAAGKVAGAAAKKDASDTKVADTKAADSRQVSLPQLKAVGKAAAAANTDAGGTKTEDSSDDWGDDAQTAKLFQKLNR